MERDLPFRERFRLAMLLSFGMVLAWMRFAEKLTVMFYVEGVCNQRVPL